MGWYVLYMIGWINSRAFHDIVSIISRHGLCFDVHCEIQPNKHKLVLYRPIHFNSNFQQLYISSKMECFGYKGGCSMTYIILKLSKEELAWATYKLLKVISNISNAMYIKQLYK